MYFTIFIFIWTLSLSVAYWYQLESTYNDCAHFCFNLSQRNQYTTQTTKGILMLISEIKKNIRNINENRTATEDVSHASTRSFVFVETHKLQSFKRTCRTAECIYQQLFNRTQWEFLLIMYEAMLYESQSWKIIFKHTRR